MYNTGVVNHNDMTLEMIPLTPSDLQRPKRISSLVDCKLKLFLYCINDVLFLNPESISALSDDEISLVDDEIWLLYSTLKVKKSYFESLDLPEYHDDYEQLEKIVRKMVIAKRFIKEIDREKYFRLFKRYDLLSEKYTNREELNFFMSSIKSNIANMFTSKSPRIFSRMCEYMLDNYGDDGLNKITGSVIFDRVD
tara:strand:- start:1134 stop:1718 length:585 start_codon:yes stop_codon:yes gene_type:complete